TGSTPTAGPSRRPGSQPRTSSRGESRRPRASSSNRLPVGAWVGAQNADLRVAAEPGDVRLPAVDHRAEAVRPRERLRLAKERPLLVDCARPRDPLDPP